MLAQPGEFPNFEVPPTLELLGDIARERRDFDTAEYHYRRVLTEWDRPQGTSGMVRIKLADVLAGRGDPHRRREARQLIADHLADPFTVRLPSAMFALYIARARLAAAEGDSVGVREAAQAALGLIDSPPVVKHKPWFGAVQATPEVLARLAHVAESGTFDA